MEKIVELSGEQKLKIFIYKKENVYWAEIHHDEQLKKTSKVSDFLALVTLLKVQHLDIALLLTVVSAYITPDIY
ncbi:hypothetical protein [Metasolibacillus meyeri]|uniref:hypothetical protein n=1 Tax=Metasolibacillus meyeri TaxID=1071052 RepID=UPI000D304AB3|nr:hypothetical protein [Metasolibacillus meyeri]